MHCINMGWVGWIAIVSTGRQTNAIMIGICNRKEARPDGVAQSCDTVWGLPSAFLLFDVACPVTITPDSALLSWLKEFASDDLVPSSCGGELPILH